MLRAHRPFALRALVTASILLIHGGTALATDMSTPRSLAMGGALRAAATGASAIFLNPAGMTLVRGYAVEAFYDFHVRENGHYAHSSVVDSVSSKWISAGLYYNLAILRPELYERSTGDRRTLHLDGHETGVALAVPLGARFSLGATIKYQYFKAKATVLDGDQTREQVVDRINNVGVDVGLAVLIGKGFSVGATGMNLVPQHSTWAPMSLGLGVAYSYKTYLTAAFDVLLDFTSKDNPVVDYHGGLEGFFGGKYALRAGTSHQGLTGGTYLTAGFGYMNPKAGVDVFFMQEVDGGVETRLGFAVKLYVR